MDHTQTLEYMGKLLNEISAERDRYKADADRLAKAIRNLGCEPPWMHDPASDEARAALKAHERGEG